MNSILGTFYKPNSDNFKVSFPSLYFMAEHPDDKHKPSLEKIMQKSFSEMGRGERNLAEDSQENDDIDQNTLSSQQKPVESQSYEYNKVYKSKEVSSMEIKRKGLKEAKVANKESVKQELSSQPGDDFDIEW